MNKPAIVRNMFAAAAAYAVTVLLSSGVFAALPTPGLKADARRFGAKQKARMAATAVPADGVEKALQTLRSKTSSSWRVRYDSVSGAPEALLGGSNLSYSGTPESAARAFLKDQKSLLKVDEAQLVLALSRGALGINHLLFKQVYNGIPVENAEVKVHIKANGEILGYNSSYLHDLDLSLTPLVSADAAKNAAVADGAARSSSAASLVIIADTSGTPRLAWKFAASTRGNEAGLWDYYVNARDSSVILRVSKLRYAVAASGCVQAAVFDVYPGYPTPSSDPNMLAVSTRPLVNMNVYVQDYTHVAVTSATTDSSRGCYSSDIGGKIAASLSGPYFTVVNYLGMSAHYDNGDGIWTTQTTPNASAHPYSTDSITIVSTVTLTNLPAYFIKAVPRFKGGLLADNTTPRFQIGLLDTDNYGIIEDGDELNVVQNGNNYRMGSYIGMRKGYDFFGPPVHNPSFGLQLVKHSPHDASLSHYGYEVDISSYLYLSSNPTVTDLPTSSFVWTATNTFGMSAAANGSRDPLPYSEANTFYHLNEMREFYNSTVNLRPTSGVRNVDLDSIHLPVMVHAHGDPDVDNSQAMQNAFYNLETQNILMGDGAKSTYDPYKFCTFAYDAGIVRHEYTHFVTQQIYPSFYYGESGAINEAMSDYWALSSLTKGDTFLTPRTGKFAEFLNAAFDGAVRDLSASDHIYSGYSGEVHDDSLILSQALWLLRNTDAASSFISTVTVSGYTSSGVLVSTSIPRADWFVWNAEFFFPTTFNDFRDAMEQVCKVLEPANCAANFLPRIQSAFSIHEINGTQVSKDSVDQYEPNDGTEIATDVSTMSVVTARIYPARDVDYFSVPLAKGSFQAIVYPPSASTEENSYKVYSMRLLGADRVTPLAEEQGVIYNSPIGSPGRCEDTGECYGFGSSTTLTAQVPTAGRYILSISAPPSVTYDMSPDYSTQSYRLVLNYNPSGSASASVTASVFDNDSIGFSAPFTMFNYDGVPATYSTMTAQVEIFDHAVLLDQNLSPLSEADTSASSPYLVLASSSSNTTTKLISGTVKLTAGFAKRYPSAGTVCLEIYGRTRQGKVASLGVSQPFNLTTNKAAITPWNNVFNPMTGGKTTVTYEVLTAGQLKLRIFTPDGRLVRTLLNSSVNAGKGTIEWDGRNDTGSVVGAGMYILKADGAGLDMYKKIVVIK